MDHVPDRVRVGEDDLADLRPGVIRCAESSTICARRQVTTDPESRRTIRSSRLPSSLVISRNCTLAAIDPSRSSIALGGHDFAGGALEPRYGNRQTLVVTPLDALRRSCGFLLSTN